MAKYLLLDGNSLAYRAFFALPTDMATASGQVTNAVYGFTNMLVFLLREHQPDGIAVAFDRPEPTFRHSLVTDYKGGREAAPDILKQQMGLVRQVVETLKIPILELATYEADDILATLATQARDRGDDVIVVTGDRDAYQLVEDPHIKVLYNKRGVTDYVLYDEAGIHDRTGVTPDQYPMYAALRGDTSDNLPGVPGVGEKTAAKLINTWGDLDGVFANVDKNTPKLRENLAAHEPRVRENYLATPLIRDVPIECDLEQLKMGGWDPDEIRDLFIFLEFRGGILDRLFEAVGGEGGRRWIHVGRGRSGRRAARGRGPPGARRARGGRAAPRAVRGGGRRRVVGGAGADLGRDRGAIVALRTGRSRWRTTWRCGSTASCCASRRWPRRSRRCCRRGCSTSTTPRCSSGGLMPLGVDAQNLGARHAAGRVPDRAVAGRRTCSRTWR